MPKSTYASSNDGAFADQLQTFKTAIGSYVGEIEVDRGDGKGFALLTYDSTPNYIDTAPFPNAPTKWTYRVGDHRVGQWSKPATVAVGG